MIQTIWASCLRLQRLHGEFHAKKEVYKKERTIEESRSTDYIMKMAKEHGHRTVTPAETSKKGQSLGSGQPSEQLVQEEVFKEMVGMLNRWIHCLKYCILCEIQYIVWNTVYCVKYSILCEIQHIVWNTVYCVKYSILCAIYCCANPILSTDMQIVLIHV